MEPPSSPSSTITELSHDEDNIRRIAILTTQALISTSSLLHFDTKSQTMIDWSWPADDDYNMIPPNQFGNYRKRRHLKYPCCLCAYMTQQNYVESIVYSWREETEGTLVWRARCAMDICGYQVKINKYFQLHTQSISLYRLRGDTTENQPRSTRQVWSHQEQNILFSRLGSFAGKISLEEFLILFQDCKLCKQVGTRRAMGFHRCLPQNTAPE
ncbi:hypothetical protein P692DRAFT_20753758 [Suillus brevipes Sb2]|nr:hypothetical protein P692DRAFT_20753758 [Suillus brevipes Sb2]